LDVSDEDFGQEPDLDAARACRSESYRVVVGSHDAQIDDRADDDSFVSVSRDNDADFYVFGFDEEGEFAD
jgi:hypothetical protein